MNKLTRELNHEIIEALTARKPEKFLGRRALQELLKDPGWEKGLAGLLPVRERLSCTRILEVCAPILNRLCPEPPEKGWGPFCYQYICRMMFPDNGFAPEAPRCGGGALFYLTVLQILLDREREVMPFDPMLDFQFLTEEEYEHCDKAREYRRFLAAWRGEFLYELMRLGMEVTPFKTLSHISGVHYIAMTAARGLAAAGVEVDLALISGAAAAHDVGKFGCRPGERVPYLHYYYTDQWLLERRMEDISHIASNHSTWDLELESLSVESLLLIYADF
ncbi:MAG: HD domain-containing protein, partial [Lawsonibacter sp.]|nr:HD domain-containing protein [Lawsonibacter sp.]